MRRAAIVVAISALGLLLGVFSLAVARDDSAHSFAGSSGGGGIALLGAGWALIGFGLASSLRRPGSQFAALLAAAGFAWFLPEWNNPGIGSPLAFTIGLSLYTACPPLAAHALLAYPGGRLSSSVERSVLVIAYVASLLALGIFPTLFFDPSGQGCGQCPRNLLQLSDSAANVADLERVGVWLGLAWTLALAAILVVKLAGASRASRRSGGAIWSAGIVYLGLVGATFAVSLDRGFVTNGTLERRFWLGEAAALSAIAVGVGWSWIRARRARGEVARLVVELGRSAPPGGLRHVLASLIRDQELVLAYPLGDSSRLVDAHGRPAEIGDRQQRTTLVRDGRPVAVLGHAPGRLDDEQLVEELTAAARLALENERLQAEVQARLEDLRASRARIVDAGDAERKRLERDLHDGAQQRLVGLSLSLRLLRSRLADDAVPAAAMLDEADAELRTAIAELRELAHGIFPAALADEGLAAAIEVLVEEARVPIRVRALPEGRFPAPVETTAYTIVAEAAMVAESSLAVRAEGHDGALVVEIETDDVGERLDFVTLKDRVGALDGRIAVAREADGRVTIRAELPCGS